MEQANLDFISDTLREARKESDVDNNTVTALACIFASKLNYTCSGFDIQQFLKACHE